MALSIARALLCCPSRPGCSTLPACPQGRHSTCLLRRDGVSAFIAGHSSGASALITHGSRLKGGPLNRRRQHEVYRLNITSQDRSDLNQARCSGRKTSAASQAPEVGNARRPLTRHVSAAAASIAISLLLPLSPVPELSQNFPAGRLCIASEHPGGAAHFKLENWGCMLPVRLLSPSASASGLLQMPPLKLNNDYYLVRAGESEYESRGLLHTNPVDKTSVSSGLSEQGKRQAVAAGIQLERSGACDGICWLWPSISQRSYQTAEVIAYVNGLSYSRIVPEYSFLDARGVGAFENSPLEAMEEIYRMDTESERVRPPPFYDGTPNESAQDVFVRVRQMMSIMETQYSGDTIVVVSPDSDNLSILQAAVSGLDLRSHHFLRFEPGEVRHLELPQDIERAPAVSGIVKL